MNKYFQIAHLIETVVNNDYSGCLDKKEIIEKHKLTLQENPTRKDFYESASAYLHLFKDRHLQLIDKSTEVFSRDCIRSWRCHYAFGHY